MKRYLNSRFVGIGLVLLIVLLVQVPPALDAAESTTTRLLTGIIVDKQGIAVEGAEVKVLNRDDAEHELATAETQADGRYVLSMPQNLPQGLVLDIERLHFEPIEHDLSDEIVAELRDGRSVELDDIVIQRHINIAFWLATITFIAVLILVATHLLPNTLAALMGAAILFAVSYVGRSLSEDFLVFEFDRGLEYIDWEVIFLVAGMMAVVAVVERTGLFQWMAFRAFKLSGGKMWLLLPILMLIAGVTSAFLDNVTTMLLMTPITVEIALALGMSPLALLIPQVMASNVAGISTLIGEPPNILIGSYADISFSDFVVHQTGGVILAMIGLILYCEWSYRKELKSADGSSPALLEKLSEHAKIIDPNGLKKSAVVGGLMLVFFVFGESLEIVPAVTAMVGAVMLLTWVKPDVKEITEAVDWATIAFFIAFFLLVGGIQEVGMVSFVAQAIGDLVGENLILAMLVIIWTGAFFSAIVDNIPFAAAMLPVVAFLSGIIPGADNKVLYYCLSVGVAMGGNGSLIGSSANLVTAGIAERAGYPVTYMYFLRKGAPAVVITVGLATVWLLFRFVVLG